MKNFEFKLKHERYINKRIDNMSNIELLNYLADEKKSKENSFKFIFGRDVFLEMCRRYRVKGSQMKNALVICSIQKQLGIEMQLDFKLTDEKLQIKTNEILKQKFPLSFGTIISSR